MKQLLIRKGRECRNKGGAVKKKNSAKKKKRKERKKERIVQPWGMVLVPPQGICIKFIFEILGSKITADGD